MRRRNREDMVTDFAMLASQPIDQRMEVDEESASLFDLRMSLLMEECQELIEAGIAILTRPATGVGNNKQLRAALLKEAADVQYVLSGFLVSFGLDHNFDEAFERVHESNLSKFPATINEQGKVQKGLNYKPPYLEDLV
jgi:predicted HAD superfamily Cof-like phosphohydrolase